MTEEEVAWGAVAENCLAESFCLCVKCGTLKGTAVIQLPSLHLKPNEMQSCLSIANLTEEMPVSNCEKFQLLYFHIFNFTTKSP